MHNSETRHLAGFALLLAQEFNDGSLECERIIGVCHLLFRFYEILDTEGMLLSAEAKAELPELGRNLITLYAQLSTAAKDSNIKMWKFSPKHHLFQHLCEWCCPEIGVNPSFFWCYADEDLVRQLIEVSQSCHVKKFERAACCFGERPYAAR